MRQVMDTGAVAGYPMQDVRVTLYDGQASSSGLQRKSHSSRPARKRFIDAINKAKPIVLEPIVNVAITVPQDNMGDITGDLSGKTRTNQRHRRGQCRYGHHLRASALE